MKIKCIALIILASISAVIFWPKKVDTKRYTVVYYPVDKATKQKLGMAVSYISKVGNERNHEKLSRLFKVTKSERKKIQEIHGVDPLEPSLSLIGEMYNQVDWDNYEIGAKSQKGGVYDIKFQTQEHDVPMIIGVEMSSSKLFISNIRMGNKLPKRL